MMELPNSIWASIRKDHPTFGDSLITSMRKRKFGDIEYIRADIHEKEIAKLTEKITDLNEAHYKIMTEQCASDEIHCGCVPFLRAEVEKMKAAGDALVDVGCKMADEHSRRFDGYVNQEEVGDVPLSLAVGEWVKNMKDWEEATND